MKDKWIALTAVKCLIEINFCLDVRKKTKMNSYLTVLCLPHALNTYNTLRGPKTYSTVKANYSALFTPTSFHIVRLFSNSDFQLLFDICVTQKSLFEVLPKTFNKIPSHFVVQSRFLCINRFLRWLASLMLIH